MTNDVRQRLCSLRDDLASIDPWPWNNIAAWSAKAIPIIRRDWPDDLDDFRKAVAEPRWIVGAGVWAGGTTARSGRTKDDSENKARAEQAKARILSYLEGLLAAAEQTVTSASYILGDNDFRTVRQQILQAILELQGDSIEYVRAEHIAERLGITVDDVEGHLEILRDEDRIKFLRSDKGCSAFLMPGHKQRVKELLMAARHILEVTVAPVEITESLERFRKDHPHPSKVAFIMMRFGSTAAHNSIVDGIRSTLQPHGITAVRADDKEYHSDLWYNVLTYIIGCGFGIAVFERLEHDEFNPNASLEVGYMYGLKKRVCLLKDKTLKTLQTDLVGKLYRPFDPQDPKGTIPTELAKWMADNGILE